MIVGGVRRCLASYRASREGSKHEIYKYHVYMYNNIYIHCLLSISHYKCYKNNIHIMYTVYTTYEYDLIY